MTTSLRFRRGRSEQTVAAAAGVIFVNRVAAFSATVDS